MIEGVGSFTVEGFKKAISGFSSIFSRQTQENMYEDEAGIKEANVYVDADGKWVWENGDSRILYDADTNETIERFGVGGTARITGLSQDENGNFFHESLTFENITNNGGVLSQTFDEDRLVEVSYGIEGQEFVSISASNPDRGIVFSDDGDITDGKVNVDVSLFDSILKEGKVEFSFDNGFLGNNFSFIGNAFADEGGDHQGQSNPIKNQDDLESELDKIKEQIAETFIGPLDPNARIIPNFLNDGNLRLGFNQRDDYLMVMDRVVDAHRNLENPVQLIEIGESFTHYAVKAGGKLVKPLRGIITGPTDTPISILEDLNAFDINAAPLLPIEEREGIANVMDSFLGLVNSGQFVQGFEAVSTIYDTTKTAIVIENILKGAIGTNPVGAVVVTAGDLLSWNTPNVQDKIHRVRVRLKDSQGYVRIAELNFNYGLYKDEQGNPHYGIKAAGIQTHVSETPEHLSVVIPVPFKLDPENTKHAPFL